MKAPLILLTVVMAAALSGCQTLAPVAAPEDNETSVKEKSEWTAEEIAEMEAEGDGEMMDNESTSEDIYMAFTQDAYDSMLGQKPFALFFHASWCPTCQFMEQDILSNISEFPEGTVILKADYDTETALKEKYSISSQSLVVMINADGSVAETLVAPSAASLASNFTSLLK